MTALKLPKFPIDAYELRAQLLPGMIVSLPVVALVYGVLPSVRNFWGAISGTVLEVAILFALMKIGRDRGAALQDRLYKHWGGKPTTIMLRWRDDTLDEYTKERYKAKLAIFAHVQFPSREEEEAAPADADSIYESAIRALLERRRGKSFPLVSRENCNYGFVRNLVGLKPFGLVAAAVTLVLDVVPYSRGLVAMGGIIVSAFVSLLSIVIILSLGHASVKRTGFAYAVALLRTCDAPGKK